MQRYIFAVPIQEYLLQRYLCKGTYSQYIVVVPICSTYSKIPCQRLLLKGTHAKVSIKKASFKCTYENLDIQS